MCFFGWRWIEFSAYSRLFFASSGAVVVVAILISADNVAFGSALLCNSFSLPLFISRFVVDTDVLALSSLNKLFIPSKLLPSSPRKFKISFNSSAEGTKK